MEYQLLDTAGTCTVCTCTAVNNVDTSHRRNVWWNRHTETSLLEYIPHPIQLSLLLLLHTWVSH